MLARVQPHRFFPGFFAFFTLAHFLHTFAVWYRLYCPTVGATSLRERSETLICFLPSGSQVAVWCVMHMQCLHGCCSQWVGGWCYSPYSSMKSRRSSACPKSITRTVKSGSTSLRTRGSKRVRLRVRFYFQQRAVGGPCGDACAWGSQVGRPQVTVRHALGVEGACSGPGIGSDSDLSCLQKRTAPGSHGSRLTSRPTHILSET